MKQVGISFKFEKATKNTYRFFEIDEDGNPVDWENQLIGSIYVKKSFFEKQPSGIRVTIEAEE